MSNEVETHTSRRDMLLGMIQKEFPQYHPLIAIARIAHHGDADLKLQFECHKTIAKYVEPELKSIEVKGGMEHRHSVKVSLFDPVESANPPIDGEVLRVVDDRSRELPGGAMIDTDPEVVDRVVVNGW